MAQPEFIPDFLGQQTTLSNAEKKVFHILHSVDFPNCYIFHSLGIPFHEKKIYGEADFVLVCNKGVLVLEVKGGRVACFNGRWSYMDKHGNVNKKDESPFNQAKDNLFSILNHINENLKKKDSPLYKKFNFGYGVMFPDIHYKGKGIEDPEVLVFDSYSSIRSYLFDLFDFWKSRPGIEPVDLTDEQVDEIAGCIRPDFNFLPVLSSVLEYTEQKVVNLTNEQVQVLECLEGNDRIFIRGGAGTGKTVLACYFAKKCAAAGLKVLFLTYNKNIAARVKNECSSDNILVSNVHGFFGNYVKVDEEKIHKDSSCYFNYELPAEFETYVSNLAVSEKERLMYDVLVLDEGQDFLRPEILNALGKILRKGFGQGKWAVFLDEGQNIYNDELQAGMEYIMYLQSAKFKLSYNCRNTGRIVRYCSEKTGVQIDSHLQIEGEEAVELKYSTDKEFKKHVQDILKKIEQGKVPADDVIFLSPHSYQNSIFARNGFEFRELGKAVEENFMHRPYYSSVQAYKGLDCSIAVIADFEDLPDEKFNKYFYIAGTRARSLLYVLVRE